MDRQIIAGWGNHPRVPCEIRVPRSGREVAEVISRQGTIARGLGRSYGDPAVNDRGVVLDMRQLDRYIDFDPEAALLTCEAGVSLESIVADFAPRGFFPLVTPGTKFVTVGGCIANDVHGKAHHVDGCFSSSVRSFTILLADGRVLTASREENSDLFWASFGGMGLLGIILSATLRLRRIETTWFRQRAIVVRDLAELLDAFDEHDATSPYSVAWIDPLARGEALGRGVLTVGDHAALGDLQGRARRDPLRVSPPPAVKLPVDLPGFALNPLTLRLLNVVIGQVQARGAALAHYEKFFYPLDAIDGWNRGYGKRGFTQYQFVVPLQDGRRRMRAILERISASGLLPFLNVLKKLGPGVGMLSGTQSLSSGLGGRGSAPSRKERGFSGLPTAGAAHQRPRRRLSANEQCKARPSDSDRSQLSFPMEGYTFAIDFPIQAGLAELLGQLDEMVIDAGGRVYLGKDAFLKPGTLDRMYPRLEEWRAIKRRYDPDGVFTSNLSRRVGLT